ncbi:uncharacterized protein PG998_004440 [Apiospora kogelbergensis]|uniref:uncharacterized protein n=1 Tax=Apiospora kogelbergensis TaxID=1337665 RepID=UPI00312CE2E4
MHAQQILIVLAAAAATLTEARSFIAPRQQQSSAACNQARLAIVTALAQTRNSAGDIADAATQSAAEAGLDQAGAGIRTIAQAIVGGGAPPADARDEVEAGIQAAGAALQNGDQSDQAVTSAAASLQKAASAGQDVVAQC